MKKRLKLSFLLLLVFLAIYGFFSVRLQKPSEQAAPARSTEMLGRESLKKPQASASPMDVVAPALKRLRQKRAIVNSKNLPINFWGKVVDQNNKPLARVKIKLSTREWLVTAFGETDAKFPKFETQTDSEGLFELTNIVGDILDVGAVIKDGYELSPKAKMGFSYGVERFQPDRNNPIVFKMWKRTSAEPLIGYNVDTRIPYNGSTVTFDLLAGQKQENNNAPGDVRITLLRDPIKLSWPPKHFNWFASIEAVDGGLIETEDEFMYEAPEKGYVPAIEIKEMADASTWTSVKRISFFLKSRGGRNYGRVSVEFRTNSDNEKGTGFSIASFINPAGSRNLQFDPKVQPHPTSVE